MQWKLYEFAQLTGYCRNFQIINRATCTVHLQKISADETS